MTNCDNCKYAFFYPNGEGWYISACKFWEHDLIGRKNCQELFALIDWERGLRDSPDLIPDKRDYADNSKWRRA